MKSAKRHYSLILYLLLFLLIAAFTASLAIGRYRLRGIDALHILVSQIVPSEKQWDPLEISVVMSLRLPRSIAAIVTGAALALSGAVYQSIFKNPMCSPDLLGVSSGACVGAASAILLGAGSVMIQTWAFIGGIAAVFATLSVARILRSESSVVLILSGIVLGSLMSSILNILKFVADADTQLAEITYWTMGSFSSITIRQMLPLLPTVILPMVILLCMRYQLNVMSLGEMEAKSLGLNIRRVRLILIVCSTLITAGTVCMAGTIGWVGLVVPHIARLMVGSDNQKMMPAALLIGSIFMLVIDVLCRTLSATELKIGILTGVIGAPVFLVVLLQQRRRQI